MPSSTTVHAYPYPVSGDPFNVPADMQALANALDAGTPVVSATAPTSPPSGLIWYQPAGASAAVLQIWDGSQWQPLVPGADTGWVNLSLASGYKAFSTFTPQYRVKNVDDVVFRGEVAPTSGTFGAGTVTLSTGFPYPPSGPYAMAVCATDHAANQDRVYMSSSGVLTAEFATGAQYVDLSALRYPLG